MPAPAFAALLFDMDGLMIDTETLSARAWQHAAEALAIPLQAHHLQAMVGLSTEYCLDYLQQALPGTDVAQFGVVARAQYHRTLREDSIPLKPGNYRIIAVVRAAGAAARGRHRDPAHPGRHQAGTQPIGAVLPPQRLR
ncbi:beta-phosphoglucomutase-like phosphatase (HAD superfamily) [Vogesella perlucida]|nr:beta-phosphoglucomutase-like phosphatase (HAD superfamily) [Vogesella perlucida]